jgi:WD40 repeat protein
MRQQVCPYCFEKLSPTEETFRCTNPNPTRCGTEQDEVLQAYLRLPTAPAMPRAFNESSDGGQLPTSAVCKKCNAKTTKVLCGHCHNELPNQFRSTDSFTVAFIGAKDSGKSHYIAVLINELTHRVGPSLSASLDAMDEQTIRRYKEDFRRHIYELSEVIPGTRSSRADVNVRYPLVYKLSVERQRRWQKNLMVTSMVFFDTAGEDLDKVDVMSTEAKYIVNSDAIIFLLDPLQIQAVRSRLDGSVPLPDVNTNPEEIIGRVARLVREARAIRLKDKIDTPVALVFSKIDMVRGLVDSGSCIHRASRHDGYFDQVDADEINESMRAYVAEWVGGGLDTFLKHNFTNFHYFGASALGSPPDTGGRIALGVAPFRVEDPLLWILYKLGVIPGRKGNSFQKATPAPIPNTPARLATMTATLAMVFLALSMFTDQAALTRQMGFVSSGLCGLLAIIGVLRANVLRGSGRGLAVSNLFLAAALVASLTVFVPNALYTQATPLPEPKSIHGSITSVGVSPTGELIVRGGPDRIVGVWNAQTGELLHKLERHEGPVLALDFSPDGKILATGGNDNKIALWQVGEGDIEDPDTPNTLRGFGSSSVLSLAFSWDSRWLAAGLTDKTVKVWDLVNGGGEPTHRLSGHDGPVTAVAFSAGGKYVVSGAQDNKVIVWNFQTEKPENIYKSPADKVLAVALSPNGTTVAAAMADRTIQIWHAPEPMPAFSLNLDSSVRSIKFSSNGNILTSVSESPDIQYWDARKGVLMGSLPLDRGSMPSVSVSQDGRTLVAGAPDGRLKVWRLQ